MVLSRSRSRVILFVILALSLVFSGAPTGASTAGPQPIRTTGVRVAGSPSAPADIYEPDDVPGQARDLTAQMLTGVPRYTETHTFTWASATTGDEDWYKFYVSSADIAALSSYWIEAKSEDRSVDPIVELYGPDDGTPPTFTQHDPFYLVGQGQELDRGPVPPCSPSCIWANDDWLPPMRSAAFSFPAALYPGTPGWYYFRVRPFCFDLANGFGDQAGSYFLRVKKGSFARIAGTDRAWTAQRISREAYPAGTANQSGSPAVVIVNGWNYPDALSASALCGALGAPLLLVQKDSVPDATMFEIGRLGVSQAWIVGGPGTVSDQARSGVENALKANSIGESISFVYGADRCATAAGVAGAIHSRIGRPMSGLAFVVGGWSWPDALACTPAAAAFGDGRSTPVLLTHKDYLDNVTDQALTNVGITDVVIVGGTGAVSQTVEDQLVMHFGGNHDHVLRVAGVDRYQTADKLALWATDRTGPGTTGDGRIGTVADPTIVPCLAHRLDVGVASGLDFPDALAGGALCGRAGMPLLLTPANSVSKWIAGSPGQLGGSTLTYCYGQSSWIGLSFLFGGSGAVSDSTYSQLDALTGRLFP